MKPLQLIMSAFGSYAGKETVDFEKVSKGIFLITGDTGSGKTTIFDGVLFALYGETNGARDGAMMRSQYAKEDTETFAKLTFSQRGKTYTIFRSPAYERISKRKDKEGNYKTVSVPAKAELTLPDETAFVGNISDINKKIVELIGVTREQFSQIAMIAQGEYIKLLHATSKERKNIFSKIFQTDIYGRIQMHLKDEFNRLYGALEDNRKLMDHERENVQVPSDTALVEKWAEQKEFKETGVDSFFALLEETIRAVKEEEEKEKKNREEIQKKQIKIEQQLSAAKEVNRLFEQKEKCTSALEKLKTQESAIKDKKRRLEKIKKAEKVRIFQEQYVQAQRLEERVTAHIYQLTLEVQGREVAMESLRQQVYFSKDDEYQQAKQKVEESKETLAQLQRACEEADGEYNRRYRVFLNAQAGIMASNLEEGTPCPVCGSTSHPDLAPAPEADVSSAWVDQAKELRAKKEGKRGEALITHARLEEACTQKKDALEAYKKEWRGYIDEWDRDEPKDITSVDQAVANVESCQEEMRMLNGAINSEKENNKSNIIDTKEKQKEYTKARKEHGFSSEAEYLQICEELPQMARMEKEVTSFEQQQMEYKIKLEQLTSMTKGKEPIDVTLWQQQSNELRTQEKDTHNRLIACTTIRNRDEQIRKNLKELYAKRKVLESQFVVVKNLYQTANGKLAKTASMDFQTFVQRQYFNRMIQAANTRLKYMTDGQFILQCRDLDSLGKRGEVGLDLDVYSVATGKVRDVKTLSGGESFMAALAMALGMADLIQNTAGNVRVDTMFIDEGFGSLDEGARVRAIRILQDLAGDKRNIGIISHVAELKEEIEQKIVVKKDEKGSRIEVL